MASGGGRSVVHMRKTFTLVLASVLATGAVQVANADEFTVIDDPASYISIGDISKPWGQHGEQNLGPLGVDEEIQPVASNTDETHQNSTFHRLPLEVKRKLGSKVLDQVGVCFYDSNALTNQTAIETYCGDGTNDGSDDGNLLDLNAWSAAPVAITDIGNLDADVPSDPTVHKTAEAWNYSTAGGRSAQPQLGSGTGRDSTFELTTVFGGENVIAEESDVLKASLSFHLIDAASNSDGWKVRVLATYTEDGQDDVILELESERTYTVAYVVNLNNPRGQVNYGNVVQGAEVEKTGLNTIQYRANNTSDITLQASRFRDSGGTEVEFGSDATPTASQVSLGCRPDSASDYKPVGASGEYDFFDGTFDAELTKTLLSGVPDHETAGLSNYTVNSWVQADAHDCKLVVGADVAVDTYSNTMTVGVGAQPAS